MGFEGWITLAVLVTVLVCLGRQLMPADLCMFSALALLSILGIITPEQATSGFSNSAVLTIGSLFVIAEAVRQTGGLRWVAQLLFAKQSSRFGGLIRIVLGTATLSSLLNNTPLVIMFMPVVREWALRIKDSPSRYLIPLAWAIMLGGMTTLIGTSTNLVISGMMADYGPGALGMFAMTPVTLPVALVGLFYLVVVGPRVLPHRLDTQKSLTDTARDYMTSARVALHGPIAGKRVSAAGLRNLNKLYLVEIHRGDEVIAPVDGDEQLEGNDVLIFVGVAIGISEVLAIQGLEPVLNETPLAVPNNRRHLYEVVVSTNSPLIGSSVRDARFRTQYQAAVLAVHRHSERLVGKIGDIVLQPGDTLLVEAADGFDEIWSTSQDFYMVSFVPGTARGSSAKARIAFLALVSVVVLSAFKVLPVAILAFCAVAVVIIAGCISPNQARRSIDISVLIVIASAFGLGHAVRNSGAVDWLVDGVTWVGRNFGTTALVAALYASINIFSTVITNVALAAIFLPIALQVTNAAGLNPMIAAVTTATAASASFSTPIGYQVNLIIYGPGGYQFGDFARLGLPLNGLVGVVTVLMVTWLYL